MSDSIPLSELSWYDKEESNTHHWHSRRRDKSAHSSPFADETSRIKLIKNSSFAVTRRATPIVFFQYAQAFLVAGLVKPLAWLVETPLLMATLSA